MIEIRKYLEFKVMKVLLVVTSCMALNTLLTSLCLSSLVYKIRTVTVSTIYP